MCDARFVWTRRDARQDSWPDAFTFSPRCARMGLLPANGGSSRSAHRPTWGDPRGGLLTAGYSSIESGCLLRTMADAFALALRVRRRDGTHCLHVTRCHGGGTRPRIPDSV